MKINRKQALGKMTLSAVAALSLPQLTNAFDKSTTVLKGNINHSVCQWCFSSIPLEDLVRAAKDMGIKSIDLLKPDEWSIAIKHGLTCAMGYATDLRLTNGFNDLTLHEKLLKDYKYSIPKAAEAGLKNLICFSGNSNGLTAEQGMENCAKGLDPILKIASTYGITICMELLNSKVDHIDYQCDQTLWGVQLCKKLGSENFKLLYDIYHMQIMEGNVIATINQFSEFIGHYHTAGVPGRHEIDDSQELYYPAIMKAIVNTGFKGFVAQEFIPAKVDKLSSLKAAVILCDV